MKRIFVVFIILFCYSANPVFAQSGKNFKVFAGLSYPLGFFGENEGRNQDGYAKPGLVLGMEYSLPIVEKIDWVTSANLLINGCDVSDVFTAEASQWINVPILTGLSYKPETSSSTKFYGLFQAGINFIQPPDFDFFDGDKISYDVSSSFGFAIGAGVVIGEKFDLGLKYLNLGKPELKGDWSGWVFSEEQPVSLLSFNVGFIF